MKKLKKSHAPKKTNKNRKSRLKLRRIARTRKLTKEHNS